MADLVHPKSGWKDYLDKAILFGGAALVLASLTILLLLHIPQWTIAWGCKASEVEWVCKPIELSFGGTPGTQCKWYHYGLDQDNKLRTTQPCCYHNPLGGLNKKKKVCDLSLQPKTCRGEPKGKGSKPDVKFGTNCSLVINDSNFLDVGRYEGFMPDQSKKPHYVVNIDYDDLKCEIRSINHSCRVRWCGIMFLVGAVIMVLSQVRKLVPYFRRICRQAEANQSTQEMNLNPAGQSAPEMPS